MDMDILKLEPGKTYLVKITKGMDLEAFQSFYQQCKSKRIDIVTVLVSDPKDVSVTSDTGIADILKIGWLQYLVGNVAAYEKHFDMKDRKQMVNAIMSTVGNLVRNRIKEVLAGEKVDRAGGK
jgi:hypothetical protein